MARIPTEGELGTPTYGVTRQAAQFRPQDFSGDASVGRAMGSFGDAAEKTAVKIGATIHEADDYETQKRLIDFDLEHEKRLDDAKRSAAPEAKDFTSSYREGYDESARKFMEGVPDHLKPKVDTILVRRGAQFEKRAYDYELAERDRYHIEDVNKKLTDLYNDSTAAPDRFGENAQRGVALIRSSRLPVNTKLRSEREFLERNDEFAARSRLEAKAAAGEDLSDEIERLKRVPKGGWLPPRQAGKADAIEFIKQQEGEKDVGWDYRQYSGPYGVKRGSNEKLTPEQAEPRLREAVATVQQEIDDKIRAPLTEAQRTALTSLFYNIGTGKGRLDQVAKLIDSGQIDKVPGWIKQFDRNADGGRVDGLVARRQREADLFSTSGNSVNDGNDPGYDMPKDAPKGGEGEALIDTRDEPVEADDATYRHLSPTVRRKLLNVARTAQRGVMEQTVNGAVARVRNGEDLEKDEAGRTSFDRAVQHLTPHQKSEAVAKMQTASQYASAVRDIQNKTSDQAEEAISPLGITDGVPDHQIAAQERAYRDALTVWKRLETMRQKDPAAAVMGDPKARLKPADELVKAREKLREIKPDDPQREAKVWETVLDARTAAQRRTMPDKEPRLLTKTEAQNLLPIPAGTKLSDLAFRATVMKAADVAQTRYGPAYAKAALQDAIRWTITGDDEKRSSSGLIAKIAVGEKLTVRDLREAELLRNLQVNVLPKDAMPPMPQYPSTSPLANTEPTDRMGFTSGTELVPQKPKDNPFRKYAPADRN